jgi:hypothetical protein
MHIYDIPTMSVAECMLIRALMEDLTLINSKVMEDLTLINSKVYLEALDDWLYSKVPCLPIVIFFVRISSTKLSLSGQKTISKPSAIISFPKLEA